MASNFRFSGQLFATLFFVATQAPAADTLYSNGTILTMVGEAPTYVEAVVTSEGKIAFAGSLAEAESLFPDVARRNLEGNTMMPGFIDPHGHFMFALQMVNQVNVAIPPVGPVTDIDTAISTLKQFQDDRQIGPGEWIVGWGYDQDGLAEGRHITKLDLDPHFPDNKVMLIHVSGHGAVLNSNALEWADVDASTPTPAGGIIARLDGGDEPAGLLMETAYIPIFENLPQPSEADLLDLMDPAQQMYASEGYTHAQEGATHIKDMRFLQKAAAEGRIYLDLVSLPLFLQAPDWINNPEFPLREYHDGLKFQGIKFTQDGSPQGKTAFFTKPFLTGGPDGQEDWHGETTQPKEDFIKQVVASFGAGLQVFIHANGDGTIDQAIEAVEAAGITAEDDRRTIVIHSQFQRPDHLPKYAELGMSPSYFTNHAFFWGDVHIRNLGEEMAFFLSPVKAALDEGLRYSNHTDFNVTPLDPFFVMWTAMARESRESVIIGPDQSIDAYTALQGITTGPAWQMFEEDRKGQIREGLLADFVILSADPAQAKVDTIRDIEVIETIKEGETIYPPQ